MHCILSSTSETNFNLATEEYFLKHSTADFFILYINSPSVVIGKHQNLVSEVNIPYIIKNSISVSRRISGGGAVYHDDNNVNFSFIKTCPKNEMINYHEILNLIVSALKSLHLNITISSRHDILLDNKKISGCAMHIFKNRVLVHGTLLYKTNLSRLSKSLKSNTTNYKDKAVKSVGSNVTNISSYLKQNISKEVFVKTIFNYVLSTSTNNFIDTISEFDNKQINLMKNSKFNTWKWIYGYSPKYLLTKKIYLGLQIVTISINVENGIISNIITDLYNDPNDFKTSIFDPLIGTRHEYFAILLRLKLINHNLKFIILDIDQFCINLF